MSLTFKSTSLQTANIHFDVTRGFNEPAEVRGKDDVMPEAEGQVEGVWIKDKRLITLDGKVQGTGATELARQQSWRTNTDLVRVALELTSSGALVMGPPDHGVSANWTINARVVNILPGPILNAWTFQKWSVQLISIDSPPEWVLEAP